ncbi:MAG TPA: hypothetical protein VGD43_11325, partial [Micromonospora sp.]
RYRIRMLHRIGVGGPWSATVAATIPKPGVTGTRVDVGVLLLTSNHNPAGNLAYVMAPDRGGEEFTFPEAGQVDLQAMYGRDYRTAMRPLERGGVEFTRTLLVNAAAVPADTMDRGFRGLCDLAWDSVPYVCVRDELENRWLSALLVPSGSVRRGRKRGHLHLAQVTVVEVTDTPAPLAGGPAPCEGLRPEGAVRSATAVATTPAVEPMGDLDIRVELRPTGDVWSVRVEHVASGWNVQWSDVESCFEVVDTDPFSQCTPSEELELATWQRRWLRAVYRQDAGGGLAGVDLYTSLDGAAWTLAFSGTDVAVPLSWDAGLLAISAAGDVTVSRVEGRNGVAGPLIVAPDFEAQPKGTTQFVDGQGLTWEVDGVGICGGA